ncbi:hypothetical protein GCM10010193_36360 [Kitasatospora atroaurantiaca]
MQGLQHPLEGEIGTDHDRAAAAAVRKHPVQFGRALGQRHLDVSAPAEDVLGDPDRLTVGLPGRRVEKNEERVGPTWINGTGFGRGQGRHDRSFLR